MAIDPMTLKRAKKGDEQAFEAVLTEHERMIYQVCLRMLGNPEDALDTAQEAAVRIWRNLAAFDGRSALSTWIYRIATNACLDQLRKRRDALSIDALAAEGYDPPAPEAEMPEFALASSESLRILADELTHLPEDQRLAIVLRDVQGLRYEEVAHVMGVNLNTAKSRISRGRRGLARALSAHPQLL